MTFDVVGAGGALAPGPGVGKPYDASPARPVREPKGEAPVADRARLGAEAPGRTVAERAPEEAAEKTTAERVAEIRGLTQTRLSILYDEEADLFVSRIIDKGTGEVVSQYPHESRLARVRFFAERRDEARQRLDVTV